MKRRIEHGCNHKKHFLVIDCEWIDVLEFNCINRSDYFGEVMRKTIYGIYKEQVVFNTLEEAEA